MVSNPPARYDNRLLRLNVGFLLKESAGYTRDFDFERDDPIRVEDIVINQLRGKIRLTRARQGIVAQGTLNARSEIECVRCLTQFEHPYDVEISDLFVYPPPDPPTPPEIRIVDEGGFIDLSPVMREEGILAVPIQALCQPDCLGLCPQCGQNFNEGTCDCVTDDIDPRLAGLRAFLSG